jgi:hypothetical protein
MAYAAKRPAPQTESIGRMNPRQSDSVKSNVVDRRPSTAIQLKQQHLMNAAANQSGHLPIQRARVFGVPRTSNQRLSPSDLNPTNQSVVCGIRASYFDRQGMVQVDKAYLGKSSSGGGKHAEDWAKKVIKHWINGKLLSGALLANDAVNFKLNVNKSMCSHALGGKLATFTPSATKHTSCTNVLSNFTAYNGIQVNLSIRVMRVYKHTEKAKASRVAITHLKQRPHVNLKPWKLSKRTTGAIKPYINLNFNGPIKSHRLDSKRHQAIINAL